MVTLKNLPEITDRVLSGLTADDGLKQRIFSAASESTRQKRKLLSFSSPDSSETARFPFFSRSGLALPRFSRAGLIAASCCLVLAAAFAFWGLHGNLQSGRETETGFHTFSSASHTSTSPVFLQNFLSP